jgi:hypothetical protein
MEDVMADYNKDAWERLKKLADDHGTGSDIFQEAFNDEHLSDHLNDLANRHGMGSSAFHDAFYAAYSQESLNFSTRGKRANGGKRGISGSFSWHSDSDP